MTTLRQLHKFGGSSLANSECYKHVIHILKQYSAEHDLIVVSAAGTTTNKLIEFLGTLKKDGRIAHENLQSIRLFQTNLINELLDGATAESLLTQLNIECSELGKLSIPLSQAQQAAVLGHGEIWSARLLSALLNQNSLPSVFQDSRDFLRAEADTQPEIAHAESYQLLHTILKPHAQKRIVITGFIAQNKQGDTVLLGRNGSDYSATSIGALAEVDRVIIWSDVAGVYSADPHIVNDACLLPLLRLDEATELARLAAPVLHSRTLQPVAQSAMELQLRCSHQPESGATHIERILASGRGAKIITSLDDVFLIELSFDSAHDFQQLRQDILSSLQKVQLIPLAFEAKVDQHILRLAYTSEIVNGALTHLQESISGGKIKLKEGYSLIGAVGAGVTRNPHHCHGFYQQLKSIPVEFISEAESGLSLVAIIRRTSVMPLVVSMHNQLFQVQKRIALALCGKGNIASNWLTLFAEQKVELEKRSGMSFDLVIIADSRSYWLDESGIHAATALTHFENKAVPYQNKEWLLHLNSLLGFDDIVVLDITASDLLASQYIDIAEHGIHLISANKIAGSASSHYYHQVKDSFQKVNRYWLYNATVGAGLPVNQVVQNLRESGDDILSISGIFSGTLSWLFEQFDGTVPFHQLVELAWQQGLTEPDPRHDLDGSDVMRKLVILARESGLEIEPENVKVESLVPEELASLSLDDFFEQGDILHERLVKRLVKAQKENQVLRYVARLKKNEQATVGIEILDPNHALANLLPCDNIFAIESKWYRDNPLVIRGPGAGKFITAGAIQSDLNQLAHML